MARLLLLAVLSGTFVAGWLAGCGSFWFSPSLSTRIVASSRRRKESIPQRPTGPLSAVVAHLVEWWSPAGWQAFNCTWEGHPLLCEYVSAHPAGNVSAQALLQKAGALVHHKCWDTGMVPQQFGHLPQVLFTMESEANYPCVNQQQADLEMSYRQCAQVGCLLHNWECWLIA